MNRFILAGLAGLFAVAAPLAWPGLKPATTARAAPALSSPLRALAGGRQWLNTPPLRAEDLHGKVVLVNFWTYSCINSLRALPYLRAWAEKYRDRGLVVIGVHTRSSPSRRTSTMSARRRPRSASVIRWSSTATTGSGGPSTTNAWPGFYFIGADGRVRHHVLGEGGYDQSERLIQQLLSEVRGVPVAGGVTAIDGQGPQAAADWNDLRSPETYVG